MVSVLASSAVDREFEPQSGQTKDYKIGIYCFSAEQGERAKTNWLGIRIMYLSGATCLPADFCFSEVALQKPTKRVGLVQTRYRHHFNQMNLFSSWYS